MSATKPNKEQMALLSGWVVGALEIMPYMSHILFALRPFNSNETKTFACDDKYRLYINFDYVQEEFSNRLSSEALLHECGHLFSNDFARANEAAVPTTRAARKLWNRAADAANNDDLVEAGCVALGEYGVLAEQFGAERHELAETYYAILKNQPPPPKSQKQPGDPGDGDGTDGGSDGGGDSDEDDDDEGCGSASGNPSPAEEDDTGDPGVSDIERELKQIATAGEIRAFADKHPGTVPGGLLKTAEIILAPPVVSWRRVLAGFVRQSIASRAGDHESTYRRRNRRIPVFNGVAMPGLHTPIPTVAVVRDTSGSVNTEMFLAATNEIIGIAKQLGVRDQQLVILDVDTVVGATVKFRRNDDLTNRAGNGGTDMGVGIESAMKHKPSVIVVMTDGYTPWPTERPRVPVVVCLIDEASDYYPTPEWAKVVHVKDEK
jgi:predicted metal-dependent peptidase